MNPPLTIASADLRDFLMADGWELVQEALKDRLYLLRNARHARRQLAFPMDHDVPDYADTVETAIAKYSEINGAAPNTVLARIRLLRDDVLRLRVFFSGDDSTLPLGFAASMVQSTEQLLRSAACTVLRPRIHHPRLSLTEAAQFIEKARFAQTEEGSFVLRVACPIEAMDALGTSDPKGAQEPFVRQVMLSLYRSLEALTSAIEGGTLDQLVSDLNSSEHPRLSSNLCEALSAMHDDRIGNSLDLGFDWSVLRAGPVPRHRPFRLQNDDFARIDEVRRALHAAERPKAATFVGSVERLDGEMDEEGRRTGEVILAIFLAEEGETVRARAVLSADDYQKAHRAHMLSGAYVQVAGQLLPGRQPRQLISVTRFDLLAELS